jgi:hypothetical protein
MGVQRLPRAFPRNETIAQSKGGNKVAFTTISWSRKAMEHFLQDLILESKNPEEIATLFEWLEEVQRSDPKNNVARTLQEEADNAGRFDVFKVSAGGVFRIGFVRGADNAKKILSGLNAERNGDYFLYDADSSTIVDSPTNDS